MRTKVKLAYIENQSRRRTCYNKRKKSFMKKVEELSVLCGVDVCVILFNTFDPQAQIWPPSPSAVQELIARFTNLSFHDQEKRMLNQEGFTRLKINKLKKQCMKLSSNNREKEIKFFSWQSVEGKKHRSFTSNDLNELQCSIQPFIQKLYQQLQSLKGQHSLLPPVPVPVVDAPEMTMNPNFLHEPDFGDYRYNPDVAAPHEVHLDDYTQNHPTWSMMNGNMAQTEEFPNFNNAGFDFEVHTEDVPLNNFTNGMVQNDQPQFAGSFGDGYDHPINAPYMYMNNYSENIATQGTTSSTVQIEQIPGFDYYYDDPVINHPETTMYNCSQDPATQGTTSSTVQIEQIPGFDYYYDDPVIHPEIPVSCSHNSAQGTTSTVQIEQIPGFDYYYDPVVDRGVPMSYLQNPATQGTTSTGLNQLIDDFDNYWDSVVAPQIPMDFPENSSLGMNNTMVLNEPSANFDNVWDVSLAPEMAINGPQGSAPNANVVIPHEQPSDSDGFDYWLSLLFGDDDDATM